MNIQYLKSLCCRHQIPTVILIVLVGLGCASQMRGTSMTERGFDIEDYKYITIYDSASASFIELSLSRYFQDADYEIIGET